jgi:hypothetical protein
LLQENEFSTIPLVNEMINLVNGEDWGIIIDKLLDDNLNDAAIALFRESAITNMIPQSQLNGIIRKLMDTIDERPRFLIYCMKDFIASRISGDQWVLIIKKLLSDQSKVPESFVLDILKNPLIISRIAPIELESILEFITENISKQRYYEALSTFHPIITPIFWGRFIRDQLKKGNANVFHFLKNPKFMDIISDKHFDRIVGELKQSSFAMKDVLEALSVKSSMERLYWIDVQFLVFKYLFTVQNVGYSALPDFKSQAVVTKEDKLALLEFIRTFPIDRSRFLRAAMIEPLLQPEFAQEWHDILEGAINEFLYEDVKVLISNPNILTLIPENELAGFYIQMAGTEEYVSLLSDTYLISPLEKILEKNPASFIFKESRTAMFNSAKLRSRPERNINFDIHSKLSPTKPVKFYPKSAMNFKPLLHPIKFI